MFANHTHLLCHAVIVGKLNVKTVKEQLASAYFTWDITWTICNACSQTFIDRTNVPYTDVECALGMGTLDRKIHLFSLVGRCINIFAWYFVCSVALLFNKIWACLDL